MATYAQVEDLRDWAVKNLGEVLARFDDLNGEEPRGIMEQITAELKCISDHAHIIIGLLDALLVVKERAQPPDPL